MILERRKLASGFGWATGMQAVSILMRFANSVILARLLAPEIMGVAIIVVTIRIGVELLADTGFMQYLISKKDGEAEVVQNTVWTMQIIRAVILASVLVIGAVPLSRAYDIESSYILFAAATSLILGFQSFAIDLMKKRMEISRVTALEFLAEFVGTAVILIAVLIHPTVISLMVSHVLGAVIQVVITHSVSKTPVRLVLNKDVVFDALHFGKWIILSSAFMYLCNNYDRLYLGSALSLTLFGIYGISRNLAEIPKTFASRIGYVLVFPLISSSASSPRDEVRAHLAPLRRKVLLAAAAAFALGISISDLFVGLVYDTRYADARWMLPILLIGMWPNVLNSVNECVLLGLGKPSFISMANAARLASVFFGLPWAYNTFGMIGAIATVALADLPRALPLYLGQWRERLSFIKQDLAATVIFAALLGIILFLRMHFGLGTPFDAIHRGSLS